MIPQINTIWAVYDEHDGVIVFKCDSEDEARTYAELINLKGCGYSFIGTAKVAQYQLDVPSAGTGSMLNNPVDLAEAFEAAKAHSSETPSASVGEVQCLRCETMTATVNTDPNNQHCYDEEGCTARIIFKREAPRTSDARPHFKEDDGFKTPSGQALHFLEASAYGCINLGDEPFDAEYDKDKELLTRMFEEMRDAPRTNEARIGFNRQCGRYEGRNRCFATANRWFVVTTDDHHLALCDSHAGEERARNILPVEERVTPRPNEATVPTKEAQPGDLLNKAIRFLSKHFDDTRAWKEHDSAVHELVDMLRPSDSESSRMANLTRENFRLRGDVRDYKEELQARPARMDKAVQQATSTELK